MSLIERWQQIHERLATAAEAAGRTPKEITLVGVCKRQPLDRILAAWEAGLRDFGESTAQGLRANAAALSDRGHQVRWHFVGALQRNKVNVVLSSAALVHSVDRLSLAEALSKRATAPIEVLVQVNIGREPQKAGVEPEAAVDFACAVASLPQLRLRGLMTLPPAGEDPQPFFAKMRRLSQTLRETAAGREATELSMGMSGDFETAIKCGATIVRIGTALFGLRPARKD